MIRLSSLTSPASMNEKEFVLWFKGYVDGIESKGPSKKQWDKIRHELALVFNKVTPYHPNATPLKPQFSDREICSSISERRVCSSAIEVNIPQSC
jgi:hypothetical protein